MLGMNFFSLPFGVMGRNNKALELACKVWNNETTKITISTFIIKYGYKLGDTADFNITFHEFNVFKICT
jgi:hypothetical protein